MFSEFLSFDLERLKALLVEAAHLAEQRANCVEHAQQCVEAQRVAQRDGKDVSWLVEMERDYTRRAEEAAARLADANLAARKEISRLDHLTSGSISLQLRLARFLDEQGRDGSDIACRAVMLSPTSPQQALELSTYLMEHGHLPEAAAAARQGWQAFGDRALRVRWADLLERSGQTDQLIDVLGDDLRTTPDDLALMERLIGLLMGAGRVEEAGDLMPRALRHPAGGTRLLASFMVGLVRAGREDQALALAREYVTGVSARMDVRRQLAESLRREGLLRTAVAFLDREAAADDGDERGETAAYRSTFFINSVRSDRPGVRDEAIAALRERRDPDVERQLVQLFDGSRGDELRLLLVATLSDIQGLDAFPVLSRAVAVDARRLRLAAAHAIRGLAAGQPAASLAGFRRLLAGRLAVEADDGVRQAVAQALHAVDPRPRRFWERLAGRRPWAEKVPQVGPLPTPEQKRRKGWVYAGLASVLFLAVVAMLPIEPSPRGMAVAYWNEAYGIVGTRIARSHASPTPPPTPAPTATRPEGLADTASGQVSEVLAADMVRVQLSGQWATVRYIGIEVPAEGRPGARAANDANRQMVAARLVYLESGKIPRDSSGRWLRYVWLPEGQMASERLLELGFAAPAPDPQDTKYQQRLADAARRAWEQKAGFWKGGTDVYPMAAVKSVDANVREGPGTDKAVKLQLKQGAVLPVVGRNDRGDWIQVRIPGNADGWMSTQVIDTTIPPASLPVSKP